MLPPISNLAAALDLLLEASQAALVALPSEDTTSVVQQAHTAVQLAGELREAVASCTIERSLHLLHGLNNKLTGAMSLALLAREDLPSGDAAHAVLALVTVRAREAAEIVRSVAVAIKANASPA